ncbi:HIT domain-containing protein [Candidatus Pacearchaeota archaeon]|nr:HIT domain-containing protein [Candidatus Pacearchaeota archaeon]
MLSEEQIEHIKQQLIRQVEENFPEDKKSLALEQIQEMNPEEVEDFLEKNNLNQDRIENEKCIFCSIVFNEIPSYKISENSEAIAVLEINPISKAHVLIIPKEHSSEIKKSEKNIASLIKSVKKQIEKKFSPKEVKVSYSQMFGHSIINLLPVYENETMNSKRKKAEKEELEELQKVLSTKTPSNSVKSRKPRTKIIKEKNLWLPRRIP